MASWDDVPGSARRRLLDLHYTRCDMRISLFAENLLGSWSSLTTPRHDLLLY